MFFNTHTSFPHNTTQDTSEQANQIAQKLQSILEKFCDTQRQLDTQRIILIRKGAFKNPAGERMKPAKHHTDNLESRHENFVAKLDEVKKNIDTYFQLVAQEKEALRSELKAKNNQEQHDKRQLEILDLAEPRQPQRRFSI